VALPQAEIKIERPSGVGSPRPRATRKIEKELGDGGAPTQKSFDFASGCEDEPDLDRVIETIRQGAAYPDAVCVETGLVARRVQELILTLTLRGVLVADPSGRLRIAKSRI
jgi:predicted Rossmann fold nucleotide-binding protein DprA/Smf involved in DNA uptake